MGIKRTGGTVSSSFFARINFRTRKQKSMRIDILTLFPEMFAGWFDHSIIGRARENGQLDLRFVQWRDYAQDKHRVVDDSPYGGGAGMVLKVDVLTRAIRDLKPEGAKFPETQVIYLTPQGAPLRQSLACELANEAKHLILVCGCYEGVDERNRVLFDREISIGDYVLTSGDLPAAVLVSTVVRLLPGVLGNAESAVNESFMTGILDYPHFTRPEEFEGQSVPRVLIEGHHAKIEAWRRREALRTTLRVRPDLLETAELSKTDHATLDELAQEGENGPGEEK
jgi:tRNA (guanine37-N1)-methyltransferase